MKLGNLIKTPYSEKSEEHFHGKVEYAFFRMRQLYSSKVTAQETYTLELAQAFIAPYTEGVSGALVYRYAWSFPNEQRRCTKSVQQENDAKRTRSSHEKKAKAASNKWNK